MQNLGQDFATKVNSGGHIPSVGQKMSFRLWPGQKIYGCWRDGNRLRRCAGGCIGQCATGSLSLMTPRDNVTPVKLEGWSGLPIARH